MNLVPSHNTALLLVIVSLGRLLAAASCVPGCSKKMALLFAGIVGRTLCHDIHSSIVASILSATIRRDVGAFILFGILHLAHGIPSALIEQGVILQQELVGIAWHQKLQTYVMQRFFPQAFYTARNVDCRIEDVDQRITQEIVDLSQELPKLFSSAITPLFDVTWFSWRLFAMLGAYSLLPFYFFIAAQYIVVKTFLPNHKELESEEKRLESEYRFFHNRLRNHAESVAALGGDEMELGIADSYFSRLIAHMHLVRRKNALFKVKRITNGDSLLFSLCLDLSSRSWLIAVFVPLRQQGFQSIQQHDFDSGNSYGVHADENCVAVRSNQRPRAIGQRHVLRPYGCHENCRELWAAH